ncbi:MAG TPA: hypothetical protein PLK76_01665 [bacterium]|nr:hypothetical protein [bacterium]
MNNFSEIKRPNNFNQPLNLQQEKMKSEIKRIEIPPKNNNKGLIKWVVIVIIILLITASIIFSGVFKDRKLSTNNQEWQAIFLSNGEVYFGKIIKQNIYEIVVNNIFYLQAKDPLQQGAQIVKQNNDISLIKLGNEIHGPTDEMRFNRSQILFIEDMKNDGRIVKAIKDYLKQ